MFTLRHCILFHRWDWDCLWSDASSHSHDISKRLCLDSMLVDWPIVLFVSDRDCTWKTPVTFSLPPFQSQISDQTLLHQPQPRLWNTASEKISFLESNIHAPDIVCSDVCCWWWGWVVDKAECASWVCTSLESGILSDVTSWLRLRLIHIFHISDIRWSKSQ